MRTLTCAELQANAAEMALGILSGAERADALNHMEHCVGCRTLVEGLAQTGDSLLLLPPEADPPIGFERGVASRVAGPRPNLPSGHRRRTRLVRSALAVAAATVLVGGTAGAVTLIDHSGLGGRGEAQVAEPALHSGQFKALDGRPVGHVLAYSGYNGDPSWVFMNVDASGANGTYTCDVVLSNSTTVPVGQFMVHDGIGEWAHTVSVDVRSIKAANLVGPSGATLATAKVS